MKSSELNPLGVLISDLIDERGMTLTELSQAMVRRGWSYGDARSALDYAMTKDTPTLNFRVVGYVASALGLSEREVADMIIDVYQAFRDMEIGGGDNGGAEGGGAEGRKFSSSSTSS